MKIKCYISRSWPFWEKKKKKSSRHTMYKMMFKNSFAILIYSLCYQESVNVICILNLLYVYVTIILL